MRSICARPSSFSILSSVLRKIAWTVILCLTTVAHASNHNTIRLATTDWCPYACENSELGNGIVYDYVKYIGPGMEVKFEITFYPWSRAIKEVEAGSQDGLLTAIPSEAPHLLFTSAPTMHYQVCFFGHQKSNWRYRDVTSLPQIRLGVIANYGYGEPLDAYLSNPQAKPNIMQLTGNEGIQRLISLAVRQRIDSFAADSHVAGWVLREDPAKAELTQQGCLDSQRFYLALSPNIDGVKELLSSLDKAFANIDNQRYLSSEIIPRYVGAIAPSN